MRVIAVEEHFRAPMLAGATEARSETVFRGTEFGRAFAKLDDLGDARLADMDAAQITTQVLSHGYPAAEVLNPERAVELARASNDYLGQAVAAHPDRFAAFATLPTAAPEAAADELSRAVTELGFCGALINGRTGGRFLDEPRFRPIFARAEALGVPIYLHPGEPSQIIKDAYFGGLPRQTARALTLSAWGWHAELGLHALRLILSGIFEEFPGLQVILGHMGELLPFMLARTSSELDLAGDLPLSRPLEHYVARHFHFTTSGMFTYPPLLCLLLVVGADRVMFAVDYPFCANERGRDFLLRAPISEEDKNKIAHGNAERLLGL